MKVRVSGQWEEFRITPVDVEGSSAYQVRRAQDQQSEILGNLRNWLSSKHHDMAYMVPCMAVVQEALCSHTSALYWLGLKGCKPWDLLYAWANEQGVYLRGEALSRQKKEHQSRYAP